MAGEANTMAGGPGPFKVIESEEDGDNSTPLQSPLRRYSCENYSGCLNITAALNWDSFTCKDCSGKINEALNWRAHVAQKNDGVAGRICDIPPLEHHESANGSDKVIKLTARK